MPGWDALVELLRQTLFLLAHHMDGSLGAAIVVVSAAARLIIMPLTVRAALAARAQQARIAALAPELERLRARHGKDAGQLALATGELYRKHGISPMPKGTLLTFAVQLPLGAALYTAIRTGITVGSLARPDWAITALVGMLAAASGYASAATQPTPATPAGLSTYTLAAVSALMAVFFTFRLASGIGIYWAASSFVGLLQPAIVARLSRAPAPRSRP